MTGLSVALASALLLAFGGGPPRTVLGPWAQLHRPLHLPAVAPGAPCPVSGTARFDFAKFGLAKGIGPGPAYPIGFAQPGSILRFTYPPDPRSEFAGSLWSGQKVLWFVAPRYRGRVLIRGGRLDNPDRLRFERGNVPPLELRIFKVVNGRMGGRERPSYTRLRAPGCYAYQIDGTSFSRVIVFQAALATE
jgi:hypothetical protein